MTGGNEDGGIDDKRSAVDQNMQGGKGGVRKTSVQDWDKGGLNKGDIAGETRKKARVRFREATKVCIQGSLCKTNAR